MRFIFALVALFALFHSAAAQLTSLSVSAVNTNNVALAGVTLAPSFSAYRTEQTRYSVEITHNNRATLTINWSGASSVGVRNCGSTLVLPTDAENSHCFFNAVTTVNSGTPITQVVNPGNTFIELSITGSTNGGPSTTILYVITVGLYAGSGSNMLTLSTQDLFSDFRNNPYTLEFSQYTIDYSVRLGSTVTDASIPFYLAAQKSVTSVLVQQCPGITCDSCDISRTQDRLVITTPGRTVPTSQLDLANSNFAYAANPVTPISGKYFFPAKVGNNCVRFINQVDGGSLGKNEYTITITLPVVNCGAFTTCQSCTNSPSCGWCANSQFNINDGQCQVGNDVQSFTGSTCLESNSFSTIPRWVWSNVPTAGNPDSCVSVLRGDPRISGLQGQDFQVHGTPNEYFNLVTSPSMQVNSRFVYLDEAKCDNFTTCFSHPGTYIDEIGVMMGEDKVRIAASAMGESARVFINGKEVQVSSHKHTAGKILVTFANPRRIVVKTPEFMMTISQSDKFFNIESALLKTSLLDQGSKLVKLETSRAAEANTIMHGLIGQTWRNTVYAADREYEGEVTDYQVTDGIWGSDFAFNLYGKK